MTSYTKYIITLTYIALVLDLSAHVVEGGGVRAGDLGVVEPLDVLEEGEELSVGDRIEKK